MVDCNQMQRLLVAGAQEACEEAKRENLPEIIKLQRAGRAAQRGWPRMTRTQTSCASAL